MTSIALDFQEEVEANLAAGKPFVIRQNNPRTGTATFHDETVYHCK